MQARGVLAVEFGESGLVSGVDARGERRGIPLRRAARLSGERSGFHRIDGQRFHGRCGEDEGAYGHSFEMARSAAGRTRFQRESDVPRGSFPAAFSFIAATVCSMSATPSAVPFKTRT